ncbi:sporulation initiation factor Spo0A C-terminal domain-containing protein [Dysosmobacter sp.]
MIEAENVVFAISGKPHLSCYQDLCHAVEIAYERLPTQPLMREIEEAVGARSQPVKRAGAVSRALARAVEDAWENGDRRVLEESYGFRTKPSPRDLVLKLAQAMKKPAEYRLWKEKSTGKCGIIARTPGEGHWLAVAPLYTDEVKITEFIRILNDSHVPLEQFPDLFFGYWFSGGLKGGADK